MGQATYPAVADVARIDLVQTLIGDYGNIQSMQSLYVFDPIATRDEAYLTALGTAIEAAWLDPDDGVSDALPTSCRLDFVRVTDLNTVVRPYVEVVSEGTGQSASAEAPALLCCVLRFHAGFSGFPKQSYVRHGPLLDVQLEGNTIQPASLADIVSKWDFMHDALNAGTGVHVILSVFEPKSTPGYDPDEPYREVPLVSEVVSVSGRALVGRSVSRQT